MDQTYDVGLVGLAVMGQNLALNILDHGFRVAVHNRTAAVTRDFVAAAGDRPTVGCETLEALVSVLERPRRIIVMVRAGGATDAVLDELVPLLDAGDVVLECGNSNFVDTERRAERLAGHGLIYVGSGVSGGEEGARHGPSIMPGGDARAWPLVRDLLQAIAAKVDGEPCCDWVGPGGAGHFVKMVHNGIEYGDMQLIAEAYDLMHRGLGLDHAACARAFADWSGGRLSSYLIEITRDILGHRDEEGLVVERILDTAGQKGTGKWTVIAGLDHGAPVSLIAEAVFARALSARKDERVRASKVLAGPVDARVDADPQAFLRDLEGALYAAKVTSYAQGFMLLAEASREHGWDLDLGGIAWLWRGGCIIRSRFLGDIREAFRRRADLECLVMDERFASELGEAQGGLRRVVAAAALAAVPVPALSAALAFYDGYRRERLPANLLQAQRDYFGGHTYERVDRPRGEFFHSDWTGHGGAVTSGSYNA
ncbi:MAG: decarboxylating NADP(+)-dependent phosphogluconate dehydrogenase [Ectothiorhodospiraceae bacterium]|nr:decarboxylating NADP(+)-dependent phosphogluconate dehydrogenase [Chromatiales bacterium]MCP5155479.1 decarboxylating NADP(+)-dependent phosphogluconate dehydrogenase [Ectothiorhodospiraceae bacterium]